MVSSVQNPVISPLVSSFAFIKSASHKQLLDISLERTVDSESVQDDSGTFGVGLTTYTVDNYDDCTRVNNPGCTTVLPHPTRTIDVMSPTKHIAFNNAPSLHVRPKPTNVALLAISKMLTQE